MNLYQISQAKKQYAVKKKRLNLIYFATADFHGYDITAKIKIKSIKSMTQAKTCIIGVWENTEW